MKLNPGQLKTALANFYGTERYYFHGLIGNIGALNLTDGCNFLRENANCFWLFDIISSVLTKPKIKGEEFCTIKLKAKDGAAVFTIDDGNKNILYKQVIAYTDFPLDEIQLFMVKYEGTRPVVMLTSEY